MNRYLIILVSLFLLNSPLSAHDDEPLFNQVNLQAQAEMEIPNDEIQIVLAVEKEGSDAAKLAAEINRIMDWAISRSRPSSDLQVRTLSYNTYPVYEKKTVIAWRASQQLELKGKAIAEITTLAGELQKQLQIKSMHFSPSSGTRKQFEDELINEAMTAFKKRIELVKPHMDGKNVRVISININTGRNYPQPMYADSRMMAAESVASPAVQAGTSTLTVTVTGSVQYF